MVLDKDGARVTGTVTGPNSASVEGMRVVIRNYDTFKPLASAKVKSNNIYRINVKATDYLISFRNKTRHPYASEIYRSGTDGVNNRNLASRETMTANQSNTYNAELAAGVVISGIVKDNDGTAVSGQVVYMNNVDGGRIEALRTNKSGKFRMWVNPRLDLSDTTAGTYKVWSRGQFQMANTNGDDDATPTHYKLSQNTGLTFDAQTVQVKGVLMSSDASPVPVPAAVMRLTIPTVGTDLQVSAGDGSFVLYTSGASTAHKMFVRMDDSVNYGSGVLNGSTLSAIAVASGTSIDPATATNGVIDRGNISMPTKDVGAGVGYVTGSTAAGSTTVRFIIGGGPMLGTSTRGDGSFKITVPSATYTKIREKDDATATCDAVTVGPNADVSVPLVAGGSASCP